jgi:hypothetical protein
MLEIPNPAYYFRIDFPMIFLISILHLFILEILESIFGIIFLII